jgi:Uma2 family endonuclease
MSTASITRYSLAEYLAREEASPQKHEFYKGQIFAMAGASPRHNRIAAQLIRLLGNQLRGTPCEQFPSDQRLRMPHSGAITYPGVSVVCGGPQMDAEDRIAATNPRVVLEVLSPATADYDRGQKFLLYQEFDSLQEYVLVSQHEPRIDHYIKQDSGLWTLRIIVGIEESLHLSSINAELLLRDIYERVEFGPEPVAEGTAGPPQTSSP